MTNLRSHSVPAFFVGCLFFTLCAIPKAHADDPLLYIPADVDILCHIEFKALHDIKGMERILALLDQQSLISSKREGWHARIDSEENRGKVLTNGGSYDRYEIESDIRIFFAFFPAPGTMSWVLKGTAEFAGCPIHL